MTKTTVQKKEVAEDTKKKVPMSWAAGMLACIMQDIDNGIELDQLVIEMFHEKRLELADSIDRRKAFSAVLKGNLEAARGAREDLDLYIQRLKGIQERLKENTKEIMLAHPDLPYQDSFGRKLSIVKNSQASLNLQFEIRDAKNVTNIVDMAAAEMFGISQEYLEIKSFVCLNTDKIKEDLAAGKELAWATLERGCHVRGL